MIYDDDEDDDDDDDATTDAADDDDLFRNGLRRHAFCIILY